MEYTFSMEPEEIVRVLYRHLLGREAEAHEGWSRYIRQTNDPTLALKGILESEEYKMKHPQSPENRKRQAGRALELLNRPVRIVDVGAQTLGPGTHIYDPLLHFCPVEITGFDPLRERLEERATAESDQQLTLLPYAAGDGQRHTLYINNDDATSSLYPLDLESNKRFVHLDHLRTVRTEEVETKRLDDVLPAQQIDLLKLDVQGGELLVLQGAVDALKRTAVIHTEVEFSPLYRNQPLFADVDEFLRGHGFYLVDFQNMGRYSYHNDFNDPTADRLIWSDAVYFLQTAEPEMRAAQALIACVLYGKSSIASHLLGA